MTQEERNDFDKISREWLMARGVIVDFLRDLLPHYFTNDSLEKYAASLLARMASHKPPLLLRTEDEAVSTFETMPKLDWRIGLRCKPKLRDHLRFGQRGTIRDVLTSVICKSGVLQIEMDNGDILSEDADEWVTA